MNEGEEDLMRVTKKQMTKAQTKAHSLGRTHSFSETASYQKGSAHL